MIFCHKTSKTIKTFFNTVMYSNDTQLGAVAIH